MGLTQNSITSPRVERYSIDAEAFGPTLPVDYICHLSAIRRCCKVSVEEALRTSTQLSIGWIRFAWLHPGAQFHTTREHRARSVHRPRSRDCGRGILKVP